MRITSINSLLSGKVVEWARIEYKETWDAAASLKTICAFANDLDNWGGGYIVIGVREENGSPKPEFETDEDHSYFISRLFVHEAFLKDREERSLSEVDGKNERSLSEVLSQALKPADFRKLEKTIKYIEEKGSATPKEIEIISGKSPATVRRYLKILVETGCVEAQGHTNKSVYRINL